MARDLRPQSTPAPHPHVAPEAAAGIIQPWHRSPYFNKADGQWNHGEGFPVPDQGGLLSVASGVPDLQQHVHSTASPDWQAGSYQGATFTRYRGHLHTNSTGAFEASFQVFVPPTFTPLAQGGSGLPSGKPIVLVIVLPPTIAIERPANDDEPWLYPGVHDPVHGLRGSPAPHAGRLAYRSETQSTWVVGAYIEAPVGGVPTTFFLQRTVELRHVATELLARDFEPSGSFAFDAVVLCGTSGGGMSAYMLTVIRPDLFHGAIDWAFPASMIRGPDNHEMFTYQSSLLGYSGESGYTLQHSLDWSFATRLHGTSYESISIPERFRLGGQALQRPLYFIHGDEDLVTNGEHTFSLFQNPSAGPIVTMEQVRAGERAIPGGHSTTTVSWSLWNRRGHEGLDGEAYPDPSNPQSAFTTVEESVDYMVPRALASASQNTNIVPFQPGPFTYPVAALHPYDDPLWKRVATRDQPWPTGSKAGDYQLAISGGNISAGTWFGRYESIKVGPPVVGETLPSIYVGSATGVVTRFELDTTPSQADAYRYLVTRGRSPDLGFGVFALDVADLTAASSGMEVVVATNRKIHVLRGYDLQPLRDGNQQPIEFSLEGRWEDYRPERLIVTDLGPQSGGSSKQILCRTFGGQLLVLEYRVASQSIVLVGDHPEPGIIDLAVGPGVTTGQGPYTKPVYVLSARRQIFKLEINHHQSSPSAWLLAASEPVHGEALDMEVVNIGGADKLVTISVGTLNNMGQPDAIRIYDPTTLALETTLGGPPPGFPPPDLPPPLGGIDLAVGRKNGNLRYVVLAPPNVYVYNPSGVLLGSRNLDSYAPAHGAIAVLAANVDEDADDEVLVATQAGKVVWFDFTELQGTSTSLLSIPRFDPNPGPVTDRSGYLKTNFSLPATWAMTFAEGALQVVDQTGTRWAVDPVTMQAAYAGEFRGTPTSLIASPIRDVAFVGKNLMPGEPPTFALPGGAGIVLVRNVATRYSPDPGVVVWDGRQYFGFYEPDGYIAFQGAGDARTVGTFLRTFCWSAAVSPDNSPNVLLGSRIYPDPNDTNATLIDMDWDSVGIQPPPGTVPPRAPNQLDLRNDFRDASRISADVQCLRFGNLSGGPEPDLVVSTVGGSVYLIRHDAQNSPNASPSILGESEDYGWGGMALAVSDLDGDGIDEVAFGTLTAPSSIDGQPMKGSVQVLQWTGGFQLVSRVEVTYGVCGVQLANVDDTPQKELIVGTMEGDLVIYALSSGGLIGQELYHATFPGAVGAFNAFHVGDHVTRVSGSPAAGQDMLPEIYFGSSNGVYRLDYVPGGGGG